MSTRTQRRQRIDRRLQQQTDVVGYRLTTGAWGSQSPDATAPDFGPAVPTDPSRPHRVVKDVVRTGQFRVGFDPAGKPIFWNITPQVLSQIATNFKAMKAAGQEPNLGKGHGDDNLAIHPDDLIAPIDDVKVAGDTLWMSAYVSEDEAKYLSNPARKVSIGAYPNYEDSERRKYPGDSLIHVAVTDRPAVNGQGPFIAMADGASQGSSKMDFAALLTAINGFMEALGFAPLPDDTSETNVVDRLIGVTAAMGKTATTTEPTTPEVPDMGTESAMDMTGVPAAMRDTLKKWTDGVVKSIGERDEKIKTLTDELATRKTAEVTAAKAAFDAECERVKTIPDSRGYVASEATVKDVRLLADQLGSHDLGLLRVINRTVKLGGGVARSLASATPDSPIRLADNINSPDARKAAAQNIADLRGITLEAAMKCLPKTAG